VSAALVVLQKGEGSAPAVAAVWPADRPPEAGLLAAARVALASRRPAQSVTPAAPGPGGEVVAFPFTHEAGRGAAAFRVAEAQPAQLQSLLAELEQLLLPTAAPVPAAGARPFDARAGALLELVAAVLEVDDARAAATSAATQLATRLALMRVSIGFTLRDSVELFAVSHSASFDVRTRLSQALCAALAEAIDQEAIVAHPPRSASARELDRAHAELCSAHGAAAACSIPLIERERVVGALTLEAPRGARFGEEEVAFARSAALLLGPILCARRRDCRSAGEMLRDGLREVVEGALAPDQPGRRFLAGAAALLLAGLALIPGSHRVSAPATLEGSVQRAIVAPISGYVAESGARAGDVVAKGTVLGVLDDGELRLERRKWQARHAQVALEFRSAAALHDRAKMSIVRAQLDQAAAEIGLLDERLARTRLVAPFDGIIVKGDLSQSLGSPVERGAVLFEIAPVDDYRIILEVDERDVGEIAVRQRGELTLSAFPGREFPLRVERVTPVAANEDGRNFFRVEASLEAPTSLLRPGLEGVAKIAVGRRSLIWILGHRAFDWARLALWSWLP
jgi:RND family efflux transporter MFP subunit